MSAPVDEQLERARERLAALDRERAEVRAAITALEGRGGARQIDTAEGRVALFASLFRGRPDVSRHERMLEALAGNRHAATLS
jgi:hypothetical protein